MLSRSKILSYMKTKTLGSLQFPSPEFPDKMATLHASSR